MHVNDVSDTENRGKDTWDRAILRQVTCLVRGRLLWKSVSNIRCLMLFTLPRVGRLITALSTCSAGRLPPRLITLCFVVDCLVSEILRCSVIWTMQHHLRGVCFGVLKSMMKSSKTFKKKRQPDTSHAATSLWLKNQRWWKQFSLTAVLFQPTPTVDSSEPSQRDFNPNNRPLYTLFFLSTALAQIWNANYKQYTKSLTASAHCSLQKGITHSFSNVEAHLCKWWRTFICSWLNDKLPKSYCSEWIIFLLCWMVRQIHVCIL